MGYPTREAALRAEAERNEAAALVQSQEPKKSLCGELIGILQTYGADAAEVERVLREEQTRRRAAAVLTIFDTALKGRSLGSLTSPGLAAKVVAENRDAILEALR